MTDIGLLDHDDLVCCGTLMTVEPDNRGYACRHCGWTLTQIEFLRNAHGTPEQRRARIATKEVGRDRR